MNCLYIEPFSGLAGDMFLAALLDLADPRFTLEDLRALARRLVPGECVLEVQTVWRQNLSGLQLDVRTSESEHAPHRGLREIEAIVNAAQLSSAVRDRALSVFRRIAIAEGRVHGCAPEEIHFHEVGAVDTIVDVCGAAFALERLGVERVMSSVPVTGTGTVRCAHGEMPVPAPAVAELLRGRAISISGGGGERLTPTGAALLVELCASFEAAGAFVAERIGYGAGHRDPKEGPPNLVRVQLGVATEYGARAGRDSGQAADGQAAEVWLAEANLDDMTGEEIAVATAALRAGGALDVWTTAAQMKKDRPGVVLSFLCRFERRVPLEDLLFAHTTTFGVRWRRCERTECARRWIEVELEGACVRVKVRQRPRASVLDERDFSPEHDELATLSTRTGLALRELERRAVTLAQQAFAKQTLARG